MINGPAMSRFLRFILASVFGLSVLLLLFLWSERPILQGFDNIALVNAEKANEAVTTLLTRNVFLPLLESRGTELITAPLSAEDFATLNAQVSAFLAGTYARKVKLINANGVIVYSTDARELGEDYSGSDGVIRALRGTPTTERDVEDEIIGVTGPERDVWVMGSYVPLYDGAGAAIGAAEIYSNYTSSYEFLLQESDRARSALVIGFGAAAVIMLAAIWVVVHSGSGPVRQSE